MEAIKDLEGLLLYHVQNLYAAEEQLLQILPKIIEKAYHTSLKNAIQHHLNITKEQKSRLQSVAQLLNEKRTGLNAKIVLDAQFSCKGMRGLIEEADELLEGNLAKDVTDAAIIGCVQKMEHYEIATYGTAHAYAVQLQLPKVADILSETLDEEYDMDDLLSALATAAFNKEAGPEGNLSTAETDIDTNKTMSKASKTTGAVHISERTIHSPGGRAGTSHRRYPDGESRGH